MGFYDECVARLGQVDGGLAFREFNSVFNWCVTIHKGWRWVR
jgi:hypothetical protein